MYWFWIAVSVMVAGAAGYAFLVWHNVHASIEASKPLIEKAAAYEQHPQAPASRVLVAGDSTGVGVGSDSRDSIAGRIGSDYPSADITNISHSGDTLSDLEKKLDAHTGSGYDIILLQIGANDITGRTSFEDIRTTLARVLAKAHMLGTKVVVMTAGNVGLSPAFMWPLSSYFDYRTREVRKIFIEETSSQQDTSYVDLFKERKDEIFNTDVARYYAPDRFHPSDEGYGVWYTVLKQFID